MFSCALRVDEVRLIFVKNSDNGMITEMIQMTLMVVSNRTRSLIMAAVCHSSSSSRVVGAEDFNSLVVVRRSDSNSRVRRWSRYRGRHLYSDRCRTSHQRHPAGVSDPVFTAEDQAGEEGRSPDSEGAASRIPWKPSAPYHLHVVKPGNEEGVLIARATLGTMRNR